MRAPFQILAIPYKYVGGEPLFCVFHRSDADWWQFIAGDGEDNEMPEQAASRGIFEESGIKANNLKKLTFMTYVPADCISEKHRKLWLVDTYVLPEYSFDFECKDKIILSHEHMGCVWLPYDEACTKLKWDSNRTALYELNCRLGMATC